MTIKSSRCLVSSGCQYTTTTVYQHISWGRCHIQQDYTSVVSLSLLTAGLHGLPDSYIIVNSFHIDCSQNRLLKQETVKRTTHFPCKLTLGLKTLYFFPSCAFSKCSYHCTLSFIAINDFDCLDANTAYGRRLASTVLEKANFLFISTLSSHACPLSRNAVRFAAFVSVVTLTCLTD